MSPLIIAEAGVNHNSSLDLALELVNAAADAGADVIKFQTCWPEEVATSLAKKAKYQLETTDYSETQLEMTRKIHLKFEEFNPIIELCHKRNIEFLSSAFGMKSLAFLTTLEMKRFKIPSGEVTNYPYVAQIAKQNKDTILSTGLCSLEEIDSAVDLMARQGLDVKRKLTLLACNTAYPTPAEDVNLLAMNTLRSKYGCAVGFSDHSQGIIASCYAAALGASVIEKHFTLSKKLPGPDHRSSCEPDELLELVKNIRLLKVMLGDGKVVCSRSEKENKRVARKSMVAARAIKPGDIFTEENLTTKRPLIGIGAEHWFELVGRPSKGFYQLDDHLDPEELW